MYHGYRLMDKKGYMPAFPFGYGLSYTRFAHQNLRLDHDAMDTTGMLRIGVDVTNTETGRVRRRPRCTWNMRIPGLKGPSES